MPRGIFAFVLLVFIGSVAFYNAVTGPGFESIRAIDVVRLITVGACFGAALFSLVTFFRDRRSS